LNGRLCFTNLSTRNDSRRLLWDGHYQEIPDSYDIWDSSKTKEGEFNFISYKNDEVDKLLLEGRRNFDIEKRKKIYHRIHEILAEDQPYTFLYVPDALPVLHKRFKGVEKAPLGIWYDFIHWYVPKNKNEWYE
jgi:peptide/nickel transport system substrate-binding protein